MKQFLLLFTLLLTLSFANAQTQEFIGIMPGGGPNGTGVIYKTEPDGSFKSIAYDFPRIEGRRPKSELVLAPDGSFYGTTLSGGRYNKGVLFQYIPTDQSYKVLHHFGLNSIDPELPIGGVMLCSNGKLYGSTYQGGNWKRGYLYWYDTTLDSLHIFHTFTSTSPSGSHPAYKFVETMSGDLLIATDKGGTNGFGTIYKVDTATHATIKLADFTNTLVGISPVGDLVEVSPNVFYGLTRIGGTGGKGVIYKFDMNSNTITKMKDLVNSSTGEYPVAGMILASNGKLYGTTYASPNNADVLFEFDPSDTSLIVKYSFTSPKGDHPFARLVEGQNGILYGTTSQGANANNDGSIFAYHLGADTIIQLWSFTEEKDGASPQTGLTIGQDGKLYGLVTDGAGATTDGTLFSFDPSNNSFERTLIFNTSENGINPTGNLIQASNGRVYGIGQAGGEFNLGVVFSLNSDGNDYVVEASFKDSIGRYMQDGLVEASNGKLYGVCSFGLNNDGTIIEFDPQTKTLLNRAEFNGPIHGRSSSGRLVEGSGGLLYGVRSNGGANDHGTLFSYNIQTHELLKLHDFNQSPSGRGPEGTPVYLNGKLYGLTYIGGATDEGVLYEFNTANNSMLRKISFARTVSGKRPIGSLLLAHNGLLYGTTTEGGDYNVGSLFEYNPSTNALLVKASFFKGFQVEKSSGELMQASNGHIYGITYKGGDHDAGVMFEYRIGTKLFDRIYHLESTVHGNFANGAPLELNACKFTGTVTSHNEITARAVNQSYQWLDCDDNYAIVQGETNQNFKPKKNGNYAVEISSSFCKDTSECVNMVLQGNETLDNNLIKIYPNPASKSLVLAFTMEPNEPYRIELFDLNGRLILTESHREKQCELQVADLARGMYTLRITTASASQTYKVVLR